MSHKTPELKKSDSQDNLKDEELSEKFDSEDDLEDDDGNLEDDDGE